MNRLAERIDQCRALHKEAAENGRLRVQAGYHAELYGFFDAQDEKPFDPLVVREDFRDRYALGYRDGDTLRKLEEHCVGA